jgi:hypothetical protein
MKYLLGFAALAAAGVLFDAPGVGSSKSGAGVTLDADRDRAEVERAVGHYMDGWMTGNVESLRRAFHPDAKLFSVRNDSLIQLSQADWYSRFPASPSNPSDGRQIEIVSTEVANTVAQVKVTSSTPRGAFTDYLSLARSGGEWKIVNKTFHFEPKR